VTESNVVDLAAERDFDALMDRATIMLANLNPVFVEMLDMGFDDRVVAQMLRAVNEELVRLTLRR
jgi:hypothetical protein